MAKVKICGITNYEDAINAVNLGADYLGFNFYKKSPRCIEKSKANNIIAKLPKNVKIVGVFVNERIDKIRDAVDFCNLDIVQLSGNENTKFISELKKILNKKIKIIKTFRIKNQNGVNGIKKNMADYMMLDAFKKGIYGGTGTKFNWKIAKHINKKNLFLSGGLNPSNIKTAIKIANPYAVDVCSGVEKSHRKKDFEKMKKFIESAK